MRNFLFAAALAQKKRTPQFGLVVISPKRTSERLNKEITDFQQTILQQEYTERIRLCHYELFIELLHTHSPAKELANFLAQRINELIPL